MVLFEKLERETDTVNQALVSAHAAQYDVIDPALS